MKLCRWVGPTALTTLLGTRNSNLIWSKRAPCITALEETNCWYAQVTPSNAYIIAARVATLFPSTMRIMRLPMKEEIPYPGGAYIPGRNIAAFPAVSNTLMLAEMPNNQNAIGTNAATVARPVGRNAKEYTSSQDGNFATSAQGLAGKQIHFDGWNYLFVDGHAKWLRPEATIGTGIPGSPKGMWTITEND